MSGYDLFQAGARKGIDSALFRGVLSQFNQVRRSIAAHFLILCIAIHLTSPFLGSQHLFSMYGINISMTRIPVSVAYTVWTALGTLVVTLVGACLFHEPMGWWQAFCLGMISAGVIGLNLEETEA